MVRERWGAQTSAINMRLPLMRPGSIDITTVNEPSSFVLHRTGTVTRLTRRGTLSQPDGSRMETSETGPLQL